MKTLSKTLLVFLLCLLAISQVSLAQSSKKDTLKEITTIGIIDTFETKSGFRINEYFIELTKTQLDSFKCKKVFVKGELLIVKGIDPNDKEIVQGSLGDRLFILKPKITIVYDARDPLIKE